MRRSDGRNVMRKIILSMVLTLVIGGPAAFAQQNGGTSSYPKSSAGGASGLGANVLPAPVGHRQPRAGDVPSEKNLSNPNDPVNKEDAALDKKIKSICRGC
jgi:hypothetical protein